MANGILAKRAGLKRHGKSCFVYDIPKEVAAKNGTSTAYGGNRRLPVLLCQVHHGISQPFGAKYFKGCPYT